jgi:hypothetical protein
MERQHIILASILVLAAGGSLGEIRQSFQVRPDTFYRFDGLLKAPRKEIAVYGIKLRKGGKELKRRVGTVSRDGSVLRKP